MSGTPGCCAEGLCLRYCSCRETLPCVSGGGGGTALPGLTHGSYSFTSGTWDGHSCGGHHIPKLPSASCPCLLCAQQRAQCPCSAGMEAASRGSTGASWCMNHNANMMTQELWDLPLVFSVIFWGSTLAQLIILYHRFLLVICRSNFQDCPSVPN